MPVISSKVNEQELDQVVEYANQCGLTISNLVKTVLMREIAQIGQTSKSEDEQKDSQPARKTRLEEMLARRKAESLAQAKNSDLLEMVRRSGRNR